MNLHVRSIRLQSHLGGRNPPSPNLGGIICTQKIGQTGQIFSNKFWIGKFSPLPSCRLVFFAVTLRRLLAKTKNLNVVNDCFWVRCDYCHLKCSARQPTVAGWCWLGHQSLTSVSVGAKRLVLGSPPSVWHQLPGWSLYHWTLNTSELKIKSCKLFNSDPHLIKYSLIKL